MSKYIDLTGKRFARLTVLERKPADKRGNVRWLCLCECGNKTTVNTTRLKRRKTLSCGCLQKEASSAHGIKMRQTGKLKFGKRVETELLEDDAQDLAKYRKYRFDKAEVPYKSGGRISVRIDGKNFHFEPHNVCLVIENGKEYVECREEI